MDRHFVQLAKQIAWIAAGTGWTFVMTYIIMFLINLVPGLHFRASEEAEVVGMDEVEHDEYVADYAWFHRDLEGNYSPEHTTQDPSSSFLNEKQADVMMGAGGAPLTHVQTAAAVVTTPDKSHNSLTPIASHQLYKTASRHSERSSRGQHDPTTMLARGRGEGGIHRDEDEGELAASIHRQASRRSNM